VVAYECLTGQAPFGGEPLAVAMAHIQQAMPPLPPSVPAAVAALVTELTAKDPAARPASAGDVCDRARRLQAVPSRPPADAPGVPAPAAGAPAGHTGAPPKMPNEPGGQPPGQENAGGARPRTPRRLSRAVFPVAHVYAAAPPAHAVTPPAHPLDLAARLAGYPRQNPLQTASGRSVGTMGAGRVVDPIR
jgi:eukaryotic-like serine/threonine-protein kinase